MSRPKFFVQHFVACLNAPWEGVAGPDTLRTLEGVAYRYTVAAMEEPPFVRDDFWLYTRMFRVNNEVGSRRFAVAVVWVDAPGEEQLLQRVRLGAVRFTDSHPIQSTAWRVGRLQLPGLGRYQFRVLVRSRTGWGPPGWRQVAVEHVLLKRGP